MKKFTYRSLEARGMGLHAVGGDMEKNPGESGDRKSKRKMGAPTFIVVSVGRNP